MRLTGIFVYPIKSCAGIALERANVVERGLQYDRRYMLVDSKGIFVTQRTLPQLCRVETAFVNEGIQVTTPGQPALQLPLELVAAAEVKAVPYQVWGSAGQALQYPEGSRWFSEALGAELSLVYMPEHERRAVNPARAHPGDIVSFADGYPLLLISEASLHELNRRLDAPLEMRRFRPNLVISGCEPHEEDSFERLLIGSVPFRGVKRCDRCVVTTIDPSTGEKGKEPLRTLAQYRLEDGKVWFGMNLIHDGAGTLSIGDSVSSPASAAH